MSSGLSASSARQRIRIIGSGALMLQTTYERGTTDGDILETTEISAAAKDQLLGLAGRTTAIHTRRRMYADIVPSGVPFLPSPIRWNSMQMLTTQLRHLDIYALDVVDVVVSKVKPFRARDVADIVAWLRE